MSLLHDRMWKLAGADAAGGEWRAAYVAALAADDPLATLLPGRLAEFSARPSGFVCPVGWDDDGALVWRDAPAALEAVFWMCPGVPDYAYENLRAMGWSTADPAAPVPPRGFSRDDRKRAVEHLQVRDKFLLEGLTTHGLLYG